MLAEWASGRGVVAKRGVSRRYKRASERADEGVRSDEGVQSGVGDRR